MINPRLFREHGKSMNTPLKTNRLPKPLLWQLLQQIHRIKNQINYYYWKSLCNIDFVRDDRLPFTYSYCTICFHSRFFRNRRSTHLLSYRIAIRYRQNFERKEEQHLRLQLCGTVKQEIGEAASSDKVTAKYDLQSRSDYKGNSL